MTISAEDTQAAIDRIVAEFVERTAHVRGAVVGSADGHPISARFGAVGDPGALGADAATIAAMGAATAALSTQLLRLASSATAADTHVAGAGGQVWVLDIGHSATLTVLAAEHADPARIAAAAHRTVDRIVAVLAAPA